MLDEDIYVNHTQLNINTIDQMINHMRETLSFTGRDLQDAILVLCAYCFYLTNEEVALAYPIFPAFTHLSTRAFAPLTKKGYIKPIKAESRKEMEGTAKVFYTITAQGYQYANSLCQGKLTAKYNAHRSKVARSHRYYIGYNFIQLLMLGFPLTWQREYTMGKFSMTRDSALQVDGVCELYEAFGNKPFETIYIEQDLCSEHNDVLVGKLENYASFGLMDYPDRSLLVFSMSQKGVSLGVNGSTKVVHPYSEPRCNKLITYMKEMYLDDVYDAYMTGYPDAKFITALMLKVGAAKETENGLKKGSNRFSLEQLKEFRDLVNQDRNPYRQKEYNMIRSRAARSRLEEMVKVLYAHLGSSDLFMLRIRRGYQIHYYATTLVAERIKYAMLSHYKDKQRDLELSLSYMGNVKFKGELSKDIFLTSGLKMNLRNEFTSDNGNIYMEFLNSDVGGWVRSAQFIKKYVSDTPLTLVTVFETKQQLTDFYNACGCYLDEFSFSKTKVLGLMLYDIGKENRLFYIKDRSMKKFFLKH